MKKIFLLIALTLGISSIGFTQQALAQTATSSFIPVDSANKMLGSYLSSIRASTTDTVLRSVIFDADSLRRMLNDSSNGKITSVKVMFAHTLSYINSGKEGVPSGNKPGALTFIIAGFKSNGNYVLYPVGQVLDHAIPCPSACPAAGTASDDYLPVH